MGHQEESAEQYGRQAIGHDMQRVQQAIHWHKFGITRYREIAAERELRPHEMAERQSRSEDRRVLHRLNHELSRALATPLLAREVIGADLVAQAEDALRRQHVQAFLEAEITPIDQWDFTDDPVIARVRREMGFAPEEDSAQELPPA